MAREIVCPSGLAGTLRPLRVSEMRHLTDKEAERRGKLMEKVISSCWIETLDSGPYNFPVDDNNQPVIDWGRVYQCDRFYALVQLAIITHGDDYDFRRPCIACGKRIDWSANLSKLAVYDLEEDVRAKLATGDNKFEATLRDGTPCWFRLLNGHDEQRITRMVDDGSADMFRVGIERRMVEVDGVQPTGLKDWCDNLELGELNHLQEQFDDVDGGVETTITIRCGRPLCGVEQEVELPFGLEFILRTSSRRTTQRHARERRRRQR